MTYRKLPGQRRGFLHGASLWIAPDHILAVKSLRFREEYKRFYLRDIQAIVVATRSRFHLSTRAAAIGALWLAVLLAALNRAPWVPAVMSAVAIALVVAWIYVSSSRSCSCRIHTAVSHDELPSLYRTWTAQQFLSEVQPRIQQVQGVLQGDWAEAVEHLPAAVPPANLQATPSTPSPNARRRTLASDIFLAALFANAALDFLTLHTMNRAIEWILYALNFVEVGGAVFILLQHHRGILRAGMQRLAIASLILMGIAYYAGQILAGVAMGNRNVLPDPALLSTLPGYVLLRQADAAMCLILGLIGAVLALMPESETP